MTGKTRRIGLWGGSFNPPTEAHKALADFAFSELQLDRLHWIVTPHNPEKDVATLAPFEHRFAMVQQILADRENMQANDIEQKLGSSWTINTVKALRKEWPEDILIFLMGTDNWTGFHEWGSDYADILDNVSLAIFNRPGDKNAEQADSTRILSDKRVNTPQDLKTSGSWIILDNPEFDVSATQARTALVKGEEPTQLAPDTLAYIRENGLYKNL